MMCKRSAVYGVAVLAAVGLLAVLPAGSAPEPSAGELGGELQRVNRSLERISLALERLQGRQDVQILLRRIEIAERRLDPLRREVRQAQGQVRSAQDQIAQYEMMRSQFERDDEDSLPEQQRLALEAERRQLEDAIELFRDEAERASRRVDELQVDLDLQLREIERLDALLAELLDEG